MPFPLAVKPHAVIELSQFQSMAGPALLRSVMFSRVRLELLELSYRPAEIGKSPRNRDHEAHCSINFCSSLERRPRFLGGCQRGGGT